MPTLTPFLLRNNKTKEEMEERKKESYFFWRCSVRFLRTKAERSGMEYRYGDAQEDAIGETHPLRRVQLKLPPLAF